LYSTASGRSHSFRVRFGFIDERFLWRAFELRRVRVNSSSSRTRFFPSAGGA
jgi:hypothetical protein